MSEYRINEAVKRAIQLRETKWLAQLYVGADVVIVSRASQRAVATVTRITETQFVLSDARRVNRVTGAVRGATATWIEHPQHTEIEREERAKIVAAAELLDARIAHSLAERAAGRNAAVKVGDDVVTTDYYERVGVVDYIYNSGSVIVLFSNEMGQGTYAKSDLCKLLDPVATDAAAFGINASSGAVTLVNSADFETKSSYSLNVLANDGTDTDSEAITVNLTNVNETPTDITLSANSVAENTATASALTIGNLTSTDPDTGNTFNYSVVGGADQTSFQITGSALEFKAGTVLDYETKSSYAVTVRTTDQGGLTYDEALTINLSNVNEKPAITAPASQSVNQAAATAITGISVADPDAGAANAIALTLSAPAGILTASNSGGVTVAKSGTASIILNGTQASLNSFIAASHVSYTSAAGATGTVTLTIGSDDDGNLAPTQLSATNGTLNASLAGGATIGAGGTPRRRAPGAGRPRLAVQTKRVFARIPASLLPELTKRGGVARVLIDALSKKSS